jgi:hypothetical protein
MRMSRTAITVLLSLSAMLAACHKAPTRSDEAPVIPPPPPPPPLQPLPPRAPGLWRTTVTETGGVETAQTLDICIDAQVDRHLGVLGNDLSGDTCSEKGYRPQGDGSLGFLAECHTGEGVVTEYSGSIDGDYTHDYTMKVRLQTTGANLNRVATYEIASKRMGACAPDQKPGDVISDGLKVNLFDMAGLGKDKAKSGGEDRSAAPEGGD